MSFYLINCNNPLEKIKVDDLLTIGSDVECGVHWNSIHLNDRHSRIEKKENFYLVRDLRSTAGTWVNGAKINEAYLNDGDILELADRSYYFSDESLESRETSRLKSKNENLEAQFLKLNSLAKTEYPVLLLGPSGTGKEILAEEIHQNSRRKHGPLVKVNCSALTETLVESELFGHIKGSFTGAIADRKGAFEAARGGTLFLDEMGDLPYGIQAKLLRALENNEIRPVGSDKTIQTDVRIIAATHQNLIEKIIQQQFRADLYYRLNVICLNLPSLKNRMEDFEEILYYFAKQMRVRFSFNAIQELKKYNWPGNIRELRNTVARANAFFPKKEICETEISFLLDHFSKNPYTAPVAMQNELQASPGTLPVIKEIEKQMIIKRLIANNGSQKRTADDLGMPKSTLHDRLKTYGINVKKYSESRYESEEYAIG